MSSLEDLLALRSLRKAKGGIEATKLASSDPKKRKREDETGATQETKYGLQRTKGDDSDAYAIDSRDCTVLLRFARLADEEEKVRSTVRKSKFTQQTNALDVDKHMCVRLTYQHTY